MNTSTSRLNSATIKVVCLGLGRTGTTSLRDALDMLGFGPCYHMSTIVEGGGKDFASWSKIGDGDTSNDYLNDILNGFASVADYPAAMYPAELFAAYPDAKYILTVRNPEKWEKSMKDTMLPVYAGLRALPSKNKLQEAASRWGEVYLEQKYHRGRLRTHTQQELMDHNERVKSIIPPEKLLVYQVGEGWDRLIRFLGVPEPSVPFPHVNDTAQFQATYFKYIQPVNTQIQVDTDAKDQVVLERQGQSVA
ncbi:hypothetical protein K439DRAFT_676858 [Ramaria rubella]|nr:hypothetical protein K439DRAFT_676858 [Ramaria rubella]